MVMGACESKQAKDMTKLNKGKGKKSSKKTALVLGRYEVQRDQGLLGEGAFSVVQRGRDLVEGKDVAVKTYKNQNSSDPQATKLMLKKFKRQIRVLKDLMAPISAPIENPRLRHPALLEVAPEQLFLRLIDYSKDANGRPGPDAKDGKLYVVTEIADYTLQDYLEAGAEKRAPSLPVEAVKRICKNLILVGACLHAKGYVHLDIKPENIMLVGQHWKLIDVDGCVKINRSISINDSSLSYSPCYCAPEWAHFLLDDRADYLQVGDGLDVWSVALTLAEVVTLEPALKSKYGSIFRRVGSDERKADVSFLEWLSAKKKKGLALDKKITHYEDNGFVDLVVKKMLVKDPAQRCTLAECLSHPFIENVCVW